MDADLCNLNKSKLTNFDFQITVNLKYIQSQLHAF